MVGVLVVVVVVVVLVQEVLVVEVQVQEVLVVEVLGQPASPLSPAQGCIHIKLDFNPLHNNSEICTCRETTDMCIYVQSIVSLSGDLCAAMSVSLCSTLYTVKLLILASYLI